MFKIRTITQEDLKRMAFTFSLADKAKNCSREKAREYGYVG
jgi:hypothetical protein